MLILLAASLALFVTGLLPYRHVLDQDARLAEVLAVIETGTQGEARVALDSTVYVLDPERYLPMVQALLARAEASTDRGAARALMTKAKAALPDLPVPRRTQVQLALAWALVALGETAAAQQMARTVLQTAGSRGFRLVSLEARSLMANITDKEEQKTHRAVGQELARDFTNGLAPDMALAFMRRPFLKYLDYPITALDSLDDVGELSDDDLLETEVAPKDSAPD